MSRLWLILGAFCGLLAVGLSAWAAHGLDAAQALRVQPALTLQGWHALALLAAGLLAERRPGWLPHAAGACFALGLLGFCGALWWGTLTGQSLGRVAPFGGTALMLGWLLLAASGAQKPALAGRGA